MSDVVTIPRKQCIAHEFKPSITMTAWSASTVI